MLKLRPHQAEVVEKIRQGFSNGHRCQLLYAPTGFGKTEVAMSIMKAVSENYKKTAMVMDRIVLVDQTSQRLDKYGIDHGVMQSTHWRHRPHERIQICSAQTLEKRKSFPDINLLIIDECFTGDTLISTPSGVKEISSVRCGDIVYNSVGTGIVEAVSVKPANEIYTLEFDDGTITSCTGNHPFFTEKGWIKASEMEIGRISFSEQGLRLLWGGVQTKDDGGFWEDSFFNELGKLAAPVELLNILLEEAKESNAQSKITTKNEEEIEGNKSQTYQAWRERVFASFTAVGITSCVGGRVGSGAIGSNSDGSLQRNLSKPLQDRSSEQGVDVGDRVRWRKPRNTGKKSTGQEENRSTYFPRLVNLSHIKRESPVSVYNIQVSGHPSYFANGKLVHNCHIARRGVNKFIKDNPHIKVIGLTASPFTKGLGNVYTHIVGAKSTGDLVTEGWLCPLRVFIAKEIDMEGAKKVAGEWSADEVADRGIKITGDIVTEWEKKTFEIFGKPRKTIVFCSGVAHGRHLQQKFAEHGYRFESISYKEDDEFKKNTIEEFAKPDSQIVGLIATDILTRGFDVTDVMIGVSARPFSKSFSSHVQQLGRVMRPHSGKEFGLWLDHSGNYLRFKDDWDNLYEEGVSKLQEGGEKAKPEPTEREKKELKCPECSALWTSKTDKCDNCGHIRKRLSTIINLEGELEELAVTNAKLSINPQDFYSELLYYARTRGIKDGWAYHKVREKFGVFPRGLLPISKEPSTDTLKWIKSRAIAYRKGQEKMAKTIKNTKNDMRASS